MGWISEYDQAMDVLADEFIMHKGVIRLVDESHKITEEENEAVCYLCGEWDYTYTKDFDAREVG